MSGKNRQLKNENRMWRKRWERLERERQDCVAILRAAMPDWMNFGSMADAIRELARRHDAGDL